jgi:hypothetical protein
LIFVGHSVVYHRVVLQRHFFSDFPMTFSYALPCRPELSACTGLSGSEGIVIQSDDSQLKDGIWSLLVHSAYLGSQPSRLDAHDDSDATPILLSCPEGVILKYNLSRGEPALAEPSLLQFARVDLTLLPNISKGSH